ncbi:MAG: hypothetical protein ACYS47_06860 [Planctomycetota bacterium]|jgi:hypothetical protein
MNEEEDVKPPTQPKRGKIPPLPPILVGGAQWGMDDMDDPPLSADYQHAEPLTESQLIMEIRSDVIDAYNEEFIENVEVAFCINCGGLKLGPWSSCRFCKHKPKYVEDLAMHFATTIFNPKVKATSNEMRRVLAKKRIEGDQSFVRNLAAGMLNKMKAVLDIV